MKPHLSRREMLRRIEQGRQAMRMLAAVVIDRGGTVRVDRDTYLHLAAHARLEVFTDDLTGHYTLKARDYEQTKAEQPPAAEAGRTSDAVPGDADVERGVGEDGRGPGA